MGLARHSLWKHIIIEKYGIDNRGRYTVKLMRTHGCAVWRGIMATKFIIEQNTGYKVGTRWDVDFWHDRWCTDQPLR